MIKYKKINVVLVTSLLAVSIMTTACGKQDAGSGVKTYARDGMLGISDVNPNMPMSPTYHTYQRDTDLMKEAIKEVPHVTSSSIVLNGGNAVVRINVPMGLSDQEVAWVEREAYDKLSKNMPRYMVKVSVSRK